MDFIKRAKEVFDVEIEGLEFTKSLIGEEFEQATHAILDALNAGGKVVFTGVGKNVHIGNKIAATMTSTGTPAILMHPIEALHGDFGILNKTDVVIAMSYSGGSDELIALLPALKRMGNTLIALTGDRESALAKNCDIILHTPVKAEACPFGMAPTASTTAALAIGDALAMVLIDAHGFQLEDYAKRHPGGAIGRTLLLRVSEVMRSGDRLALLNEGATVRDALHAMTEARSGCVAITNSKQQLLGIFTDGDLRRQLTDSLDVLNQPVADVMTAGPLTVQADHLAADILKIYEEHNVDDLIVLDEAGTVVGMVDIQDLPKMKIL